MSLGVPVKLLHEAEGHTITLELKTGEIYRGQLIEAEDNMNCQLGSVSRTGTDGRVTSIERCYVRGSQVRFVIVPDMLKNAPMFKRLEKGKGAMGLGRAVGIGRATRQGPPGRGGRGAGGPGRGR